MADESFPYLQLLEYHLNAVVRVWLYVQLLLSWLQLLEYNLDAMVKAWFLVLLFSFLIYNCSSMPSVQWSRHCFKYSFLFPHSQLSQYILNAMVKAWLKAQLSPSSLTPVAVSSMSSVL